ncbi:MarR family transcriptional regulator [Micromonospora sp. MA102]|uniref:MarR family winged helix-turn-helix transcriptional regulator n=1 Tax=Micromonospora sp. MA102 TaxID=2952755 RepID=UPI00290570D3|nr:MarR family transcriptional regulator [Micromonospora sp. MA102]
MSASGQSRNSLVAEPGQTAHEWLAHDIGHVIRLGRQLHTAFKNADSPSLLTPAQFAVLLSLSRVPDIDQRTVADLAALDQSTVSQLVRRLIDKDLLTSRADPNDARRHILRASRAAVDLVESDGRRLRRADELFLAPLSPAERSWLLTQLRLIAFSRLPDASTYQLPESSDGIAIAETNWAFGRLIRLCLQLHDAFWAEEIGSIVTPVSHTALGVLAGTGPLEQGVLGEALSLDKASTAGLVSRMERDGLLEIRLHDGDRRRKVLRLTSRGRDTLKLTARPFACVSHRLLEPVRPDNRGHLLDVLRKVTVGRQ